MDSYLRKLERRWLQTFSLQDRDRYFEALRKSDLSSIDRATDLKLRAYLSEKYKPKKQKGRIPRFPVARFALMELDDSTNWEISVLSRVGYIGSIYLVDLSPVFLASSIPSFLIIPLYPAIPGYVPGYMADEIFEEFEADEIYVDESTLNSALRWKALNLASLGINPDQDSEEGVINDLIEELNANHIL